MPVIVVAPNNELLEKLKSNIEEVRARGGELYVFADGVPVSTAATTCTSLRCRMLKR
jgi:glucosamine 6-phosphate synthetase-like amidotransferase/phosphosugar isomerase protein